MGAPARWRRSVERYRSEASVRALARRHGISPTTVQKWRKRQAACRGSFSAWSKKHKPEEIIGKAREGATAFDAEAIRRRIENLDRAASRAGEERLELTARIASLESTIAREGTSGPAGRFVETREEEEGASLRSAAP